MAQSVGRLSWTRQPGGWTQFQAWQARRRAMREDFDLANQSAVAGFGAAWSNQISGANDSAARAAMARITAAGQSKTDRVA